MRIYYLDLNNDTECVLEVAKVARRTVVFPDAIYTRYDGIVFFCNQSEEGTRLFVKSEDMEVTRSRLSHIFTMGYLDLRNLTVYSDFYLEYDNDTY